MPNIISDINIIPITPKNGHIAFVSFVVERKLAINYVAVYTRFSGGIRLVYPRKKNLDIVYPIEYDFGNDIEIEVYKELIKFGLFSV